jgi:hypothetical protein
MSVSRLLAGPALALANDEQRCGLTWLRTSGSWQLLSEHCVQIAPTASAPAN